LKVGKAHFFCLHFFVFKFKLIIIVVALVFSITGFGFRHNAKASCSSAEPFFRGTIPKENIVNPQCRKHWGLDNRL